MNPVNLEPVLKAMGRLGDRSQNRFGRQESMMPQPMDFQSARTSQEGYDEMSRRHFSSGMRRLAAAPPTHASLLALCHALGVEEIAVKRLLAEGLELNELPFITEDELRALVDDDNSANLLWAYIRQKEKDANANMNAIGQELNTLKL